MVQDVETGFAQLAFSFLEDKAPKLKNYLLGFEIIEKDETYTKMIGTFILQIGGNFLFIPVFYRNGRLKPLELLYLKNEEAFVPLNNEYINFLLKYPARRIGDLIDKQDLFFARPNLGTFIDYPATGRFVSASVKPKIEEFFLRCKNSTKFAFLNAIKKNALLLEKMTKLGRLPLIKACAPSPIPAKKADAKIEIILPSAPASIKRKLYDSDREALSQNEIIVKDVRKENETSVLYNVQYLKKLQNPPKSGCYYVISKEGLFKPCLVLVYPKSFISHHSEETVLVIDLKTLDYTDSFLRDVWVKDTLAFRDNKELIGKAVAFEDVKSNKGYVALDETFSATMPFYVTNKFKNSDGLWVLSGCDPASYKSNLRWFSAETVIQKPLAYAEKPQNNQKNIVQDISDKLTKDTPFPTEKHYAQYQIIISPVKDSRLALLGDSLVVPVHFRFLPLGNYINFLGTLADITFGLYRKGMEELLVRCDGSEYILSLNGNGLPALDKLAALKTLLTKYNIRGDEAKRLLKEAFDIRPEAVRRFIKRALFEPLLLQYPETRLEYKGQAYGAPLPLGRGENIYRGPSEGYPRELNLDLAYQAAQLGDKPVFDASILSVFAMLEDERDTIKSYLPDLQVAVDRLGRILFFLWSKIEKFRDDFTPSQLLEFETLVRNVFKSLGNIVITVKNLQ